MSAGKIIKAGIITVAEVETKKQILKDEQVALVTILDTLQPLSEASRYKVLKTVCEFFGLQRMVD